MLNKVLPLCSASAKKIQITFFPVYHSALETVSVFVNNVLVATYSGSSVTINVREGDRVHIQCSRLEIYKGNVSGADFSVTYDSTQRLYTAVITPTSEIVSVGTYNSRDK